MRHSLLKLSRLSGSLNRGRITNPSNVRQGCRCLKGIVAATLGLVLLATSRQATAAEVRLSVTNITGGVAVSWTSQSLTPVARVEVTECPPKRINRVGHLAEAIIVVAIELGLPIIEHAANVSGAAVDSFPIKSRLTVEIPDPALQRFFRALQNPGRDHQGGVLVQLVIGFGLRVIAVAAVACGAAPVEGVSIAEIPVVRRHSHRNTSRRVRQRNRGNRLIEFDPVPAAVRVDRLQRAADRITPPTRVR